MMRMTFVLSMVLAAACSKESDPAPAKTSPTAPTPPAAPAAQPKPPDPAPPAPVHAEPLREEEPAAPHAKGEHAHESPHGGEVVTTSGGHLELIATRDGKFQLWVLDDKLAPRPLAGVTATVKVAESGYPDVTLQPAGDHFEGQGQPIKSAHAAAVATVKVGGKAETGRFKLHLEGATGGH